MRMHYTVHTRTVRISKPLNRVTYLCPEGKPRKRAGASNIIAKLMIAKPIVINAYPGYWFKKFEA